MQIEQRKSAIPEPVISIFDSRLINYIMIALPVALHNRKFPGVHLFTRARRTALAQPRARDADSRVAHTRIPRARDAQSSLPERQRSKSFNYARRAAKTAIVPRRTPLQRPILARLLRIPRRAARRDRWQFHFQRYSNVTGELCGALAYLINKYKLEP